MDMKIEIDLETWTCTWIWRRGHEDRHGNGDMHRHGEINMGGNPDISTAPLPM
jgi:hypothetical protein